MNVLLLAKKNPYPPNDGEAIAILQMAKGLRENGNKVSILFMSTPKHNYPLKNIPQDLSANIHFHEIWVDNQITFAGAFINLFKKLPYHAERFYKKSFNNKLLEILAAEKFDLVQCEGLYLTGYTDTIRSHSTAKICYRSHNIESNIWKRYAAGEKNGIRKFYLNLQARKLLNYELSILSKVDAIVPISKSDLSFYLANAPETKLKYNPTGIDNNKIDSGPGKPAVNQLYFLGALDWLPNRQGLLWFIQHVYPLIIEKNPVAHLHVAGRNSPGGFSNELGRKNISFYGEVENANGFIADKFICVVPLLSGSGMKIKIPEAMAAGKLVITTATGAEGMPDGMEKFMLTAKDENEFAAHVDWAITHPDEAVELAERGKTFVINHLDNHQLTGELTEFYKSLWP